VRVLDDEGEAALGEGDADLDVQKVLEEPATVAKCQFRPGVDVMITIFDNFRRKNWRFSQKPTL
jgi:hypothetical protein